MLRPRLDMPTLRGFRGTQRFFFFRVRNWLFLIVVCGLLLILLLLKRAVHVYFVVDLILLSFVVATWPLAIGPNLRWLNACNFAPLRLR